jgi:nucleotide-binding universal stress UspA family protein
MALDAELDTDAQSAEQVLVQAEQIAQELDAKIEGEILQARDAAHAIVDEAMERGVNAIILGVDYEMPLGEFELGSKAQYVIEHAPCQVIVVREAARGVGA